MRKSYTCYGVRVYGKRGDSRIYPALNTHGSSRRPRVPGGGAPPREAAAPSAGTLHHQPLFRRGRISIPPGDRLAQVWGVGVGEWDAVGAASPLASNARYRRVAGETCLEQMTPAGDPGALTAGLWRGQAEPPGLADQVRVQGKAPAQRPPQAPGLWGRDRKEPPSSPRPAEPAEAFGGRATPFHCARKPSLGHFPPLEILGTRRETLTRSPPSLTLCLKCWPRPQSPRPSAAGR